MREFLEEEAAVAPPPHTPIAFRKHPGIRIRMGKENQGRPPYLYSAFWLFLMLIYGIRWIVGSSVGNGEFNLYLILFIILRRIEVGNNGLDFDFKRFFSKN